MNVQQLEAMLENVLARAGTLGVLSLISELRSGSGYLVMETRVHRHNTVLKHVSFLPLPPMPLMPSISP